MKFMLHKKSRVMDQMRSMDKNGSGFIKNENFIKNILNSKFRTSEREMRKVRFLSRDHSIMSLFNHLGGSTV